MNANYSSLPASGDGTDVHASRLFMALAIALVTLAFIMPVGDSWRRSTFPEYVDAESTEVGARDGNMSRQLTLGGMGLFGLIAICWPGGKRIQVDPLLGGLCLAYLLWCAASCVWAQDPNTSFKRWLVLICEGLAGLGIAKRTTAYQFLLIVFGCTLAWLGLGISAELANATFRPWEQAYRFAGIFHPNQMGIVCGVLTMASFYLAFARGGGNRLLLLVAAVGFGFVLLSGSRTAAAAMILSIGSYWLLMAPFKTVLFRGVCGVSMAGALLVAYGLGAFDVSANLVTMGRVDNDVGSLTGRTPLWAELFYFVRDRPLLGYGYNAFWTSDRIADISHSQRWALSSAHNTYIDLLLNVGLVGAVLCLAAMLLALVRAARIEQQHPKLGYGFISMIVIYGLASGLLETTIGLTWSQSFIGICGVCYLAMCLDPAVQSASALHGQALYGRGPSYFGREEAPA